MAEFKTYLVRRTLEILVSAESAEDAVGGTAIVVRRAMDSSAPRAVTHEDRGVIEVSVRRT